MKRRTKKVGIKEEDKREKKRGREEWKGQEETKREKR